jgi:hypothetical protein
MSVRPISFDNGAGFWEYVHDEAGHSGTLDPVTVIYGTRADGSLNQDMIIVPCPEADAVSYWPPGGGADALMGQSMHVLKAMEPTTARSTPLTLEEATAQVKARVVATDGEERWILDEAALSVLEAAAHK